MYLPDINRFQQPRCPPIPRLKGPKSIVNNTEFTLIHHPLHIWFIKIFDNLFGKLNAHQSYFLIGNKTWSWSKLYLKQSFYIWVIIPSVNKLIWKTFYNYNLSIESSISNINRGHELIQACKLNFPPSMSSYDYILS